MNDLLFVYGTLRPELHHVMSRKLARKSTFLGRGRVNAELYDLGHYPGLILPERIGPTDLPHSDDQTWVWGEVYALHPESATETWHILDHYEGCHLDDPQPHEYVRQKLPVTLQDGQVVEAWAYIIQSLPPSAVRVLSGDYLKWVAE